MKKRFYVVLSLLMLAAFALTFAAGTITAQEKVGEQPWIEYMQVPINGAEPAECAGQEGCVVMCFHIAEDVQEYYEWELSCLPMIVQN